MRFSYLMVTTLILILFAWSSYLLLDLSVLIKTSGFINFHPLMMQLSQWVALGFGHFIWISFSVIAMAIMYWRADNIRQMLRSKVTQFFLSILLTIFFCGCLKVLFGRYRPEMFLTQHLFGFIGWSMGDQNHSMPSDHTALLFAIATTVSYFFNKKWVYGLLYFIAAVLAISRLLLCKHYPSDLFIGALIGIWGSYCAYYLCKRYRAPL